MPPQTPARMHVLLPGLRGAADGDVCCAARRVFEDLPPEEESLDLFHDGGLELHGAEAIDLAVNVVIAALRVEANVSDLHSGLERLLCALDFHGLDDGDGIAIIEDISDRVNDDVVGCHCGVLFTGELMSAFGADDQRVEFVGVFTAAFRAGGDGVAHSAS